MYCVLDLAEQFDLTPIEREYRHRDARGGKGYHPAMMTALLLYGYAVGMPSSRRLERATYEDVAVRVLTGGQHPDHTRISKFRGEHLGALAKQQEASATNDDRTPPTGSSPAPLPRHQVKTTRHGAPAPKAQRNFTDPESRIMKHQGGYIQGYNGQIAVDDTHQVVVAHALTNQAPDVQHLPVILERIEANTGTQPKHLTADAGYWSEANAAVCDEHGITALIATGRLKHGETPPPARGRPSQHLDAKGHMWRKLRTTAGRAVYARRKAVVEPCFGQIKGRGFWKLLLRGLEKAQAEWALIAMSHNLLKYYRVAWQPA